MGVPVFICERADEGTPAPIGFELPSPLLSRVVGSVSFGLKFAGLRGIRKHCFEFVETGSRPPGHSIFPPVWAPRENETVVLPRTLVLPFLMFPIFQCSPRQASKCGCWPGSMIPTRFS